MCHVCGHSGGAPCQVLAHDPDEEELAPHRVSSIMQTSLLFATLVQNNKRTIAFCKSRKLVELVLRYSKELLQASSQPHLASRVCSYRGGYTKNDRRAIEQSLFCGDLLGVVSTCALELGIDVGGLDATLHLGVPDSNSSLWQQAGRAGRGQATAGSSLKEVPQAALSIVVCFDSPVDQYYARHPEQLFRQSCERVVVDPFNKYVLQAHLLCAAKELPIPSLHPSGTRSSASEVERDHFALSEEEAWLWAGLAGGGGRVVAEAVEDLCRAGQLIYKREDGCLRCSARIGNPAKDTNLRMVDRASFQVRLHYLDPLLLVLHCF
jgi:ATP-dependent helicase YprA (DUF1998 family)